MRRTILPLWDNHNTSRAIQVSRPESTKDTNSAMTHVQQQTLLKQQRDWTWSGMVIDDLRCLCIGILIAPRVFWLPHFLPTDVTLVTTQPLEAALEHEATNCFSRESSSAGEKQLPSHCGLEGHWTANHAQVQVVTCSWQKSNSYKAKQATALLTHALFFPFDCGCWLRC